MTIKHTLLFTLTLLVAITVGRVVADLPGGKPLLTWDFPTQNVDNTPLNIEQLKETVLQCYPNPDKAIPATPPKNVSKTIIVPDTFWQAEAGDFDSGEYTCIAMVTNTDGISSDASDPLSFLVPYKTPSRIVTFGVE